MKANCSTGAQGVDKGVKTMKFSKEQIEKAKNCATLEEFMTLVKAEGFDLSEEKAKNYFKAVKADELSEEDLSAVAGGKCVPKAKFGVGSLFYYYLNGLKVSCYVEQVEWRGGEYWYYISKSRVGAMMYDWVSESVLDNDQVYIKEDII